MNFWQNIPKPVIGLSPMDGVTDASFRFITAKHGCPDVVLTEFGNIQSAIYAPELLLKDFIYSEIERPVVAQIYGKTPDLFYKTAHIVGELGFDGLDINMGCPARKVAAAGCGAALIGEPELVRAIMQATRQGLQDWYDGQTLKEVGVRQSAIAAFKAANRRRVGMDTPAERCLLPVSIKTRIGYDRIVVKEWMATLLEERPAVITLHGRTLQQGYKGTRLGRHCPGGRDRQARGRCCSAMVTCKTCRKYTGASVKPESTVFSSAERQPETPGFSPTRNR
jgi:tRNA-dihydrouridine synthase